MTSRRILWLGLAALWLVFFGWYTSFGGPLSEEEIEGYMAVLEERAKGRDPGDALVNVRKFLESDTGDDFVIVNAIDYKSTPDRVEGVPENATSEEVVGQYMAYMWPALISRACHPVLVGRAAANAVDAWGIEGAEEWSMAGLFRYRSRRDMMDIVANPAFGDSHVYKIAAMNKTIAFPIDPWFQLGDPRLFLALVLVVLGCAIERLLARGAHRTA